jgi:isochorismate synthase
MGNKEDKKSITSKKHKAFVIFRFPNKSKINIINGYAEVANDLNKTKDGFVIQSFDTKKNFIIKKAEVKADFSLMPKFKKPTTSKKSFIQYINAIKQAIKNNQFEKVVAAKGLAVAKPKNYDPLIHFQNALEYQEAFVCLIFIENQLCWLCATPELLLKTTDKTITTYSLAGTVKGNNNFSKKEIIEQSIVTKDILEKLEKLDELKKSTLSSKIIANGDLKHLLAEIKAKKKRKISWQKIAHLLHPTPATAGFPVNLAQSFIKKNETLVRGFYSGFLGVVSKDNAKLFVNLRCVDISDKELYFYGGCGITDGSNPEKEWQETEHKVDILRSLIS